MTETTQISPLAVVSEGAQIGSGVKIEPFAIIEDNVTIGDNCFIGPHSLIAWGTRLGRGCRVFQGAVAGTIPQDLKFGGEETYLEVGDETTLREYCTLNRGTSALGHTKVGSNCLIMAYAHVAHDCIIGNNVIMANSVNLAGHVTIEDYAIIGGMTPVHQFVRIGKYSITGGLCRANKDIPPFIMAGEEPLKYCGINKIGLTRNGFSADVQREIKKAYKIIYRSGLNTTQGLNRVKEEMEISPEIKDILEFFKKTERGAIRG